MKIELNESNYRRCLKFSLKLWYSKSKGIIDFRTTGTRRDIGDYATDFTSGKLAEIAFCRYLKHEHGISACPDFKFYPGQVAVDQSDVTRVKIRKSWKRPEILVDVKASKSSAKYFLVAEKEFATRPYDAYVMVFVDLPKDHLIRIAAPALDLPSDLRKEILPIKKFDADIVGFAWRRDIQRKGKKYRAGSDLCDPKNPRRKLVTLKVDNLGFPLNRLRNTERDWENLARAFINGR